LTRRSEFISSNRPAAASVVWFRFTCRQEGEVNLRAATEVNAVSASLTPPVSRPIQLELFPGASLCPQGEACHDSEYSENETESPGRCIGRQHAQTEHQVNRRDLARSGGGNSAW
jgi:hypothetical protein